MRRHHGWSFAFAAAVSLIVTPASTQQPDARAAEVIGAARQALGGEGKISAIRSLSVRGSYQRELGAPGGPGQNMVMIGPGGGSTQVSGDVEIDVLFPDKYIKVDTSSGMATITRTEGFDGDRPLFSVHSSSPAVRIMTDFPTEDPARARSAVGRARADLARLLLGMIASPQPGFPVSYAYAGQAESPDGKAHVIDVKGPEGFAARLFIDTGTHLPLMLTYMAPEARMMRRTVGGPGGAPPGGSNATRPRNPVERSQEERERPDPERSSAAEPPKLVEFRLFFSEFREVGGVMLPHRISRGTADATTEEWEIKSYKLNPAIKPDRFTAS